VPSRFTLLTLLGLAVVAGAGFDRLTARLGRSGQRAFAALAAAVLVAEFYAAPLKAIPYSVDIPSIDRWLADQRKPFVVAELPLSSSPDRAMQDQRQSVFMLHSTAHWQKTVHGYSGMQPALHDALYAELPAFPDDDVLANLASLGVTYVVIHPNLYAPGERMPIEAIERASDWLTLVHADETGRVYAVHRPPPEVAVKARHAAFAAAVAARDAAQCVRFYDDRAVLVPAVEPLVSGRSAIAEWLTGAFARTPLTLASEVGELVIAGNEAYMTGTFGAARGSGKYTEVWRFADGQWRIAYQTFGTVGAGRLP